MPDNPHSCDHGVAATVDSQDSTASSKSPTWLWQTTGALVGAIPGQLLLFLPVNQRIALSIAGALIGLMAFYEGIGLLRLLALSLVPLLGNGAVAVLDEVGVEPDKRESQETGNAFEIWITTVEGIGRPWLVLFAMVIAALIAGGIGWLDSLSIKEGKAGWILPYDNSRVDLGTQIAYLAYSTSALAGFGTVTLFSPRYRRILGFATFVAMIFASIIAIASISELPKFIDFVTLFMIMGMFATLMGILLITLFPTPNEGELENQ